MAGFMGITAKGAAVCAIVGILLGGLSGEARADSLPQTSAEFFRLTNVFDLHLRFSADEWKKMEPEGGRGGFFGGGGPGRGGPGGGRPNGPDGPGGRRNDDFGPGMFLTPTFLKNGDADHDGKVSETEFKSLAEKWFGAWDKDKTGKLTRDQVATGLNSVIEMPNFGGPGGGGPGGPGGGGGPRGGGMNLQGAEGKRNGLASAAGIEFKYVHADLEVNGEAFKDVGVRYKGNGTWMNSQGSNKRSMKVDLNKNNKGQKIAGFTTLNLHNNVTDASWMNEVLSYRLFRDAGVPAPRSSYARVYVTVPGQYDRQYLGLYSIIEAPDKHFASKTFKVKDGAVFKPVTPDLFADLGDNWAKYNQTYDPKGDITDAQKQRVMDFSKLVSHASDAEFAEKLPQFLDLDEFARFIGVEAWLSTMDSILAMGQNFYVYLHPGTQKFQFLPWDLDHSFGQFPMIGSQEDRENLSLMHPWRGDNRFLERVFKVEAFRKIYLARMNELAKTVLKPERIAQQVDEVAAAIRPAVKDESAAKLKMFDRVVSGKSIRSGPMGGAPSADDEDEAPNDGPRRGGFGGSTKPIKGFVTARSQAVADQLAGKSEGVIIQNGFGPGGGMGSGRRGPQGGQGGPGGQRPGGNGPDAGPGGGPPGGPGGFGPGMMFSGTLVTAFDTDKNGNVSHDEFVAGFSRWFASWNADKSGSLTEDQLRKGINTDLAPRFDGPPPF
jgi:spore coat protein CotH